MQSNPDINISNTIDLEEGDNDHFPQSSTPLSCEFTISDYDDLCEDYSHIDNVICLTYNPFKIAMLIFLNLITCFTINLFLVWFTSLQLQLIYSKVPLGQGRFFGIYGIDGKFTIVPIETIALPQIASKSFIKAHFNFCFNSNKLIAFTFKLFKYVYDSNTNHFTALKYDIKSTNELIHKEGTKGLNDNEIHHQFLLFGECDLNIQIKSFFLLLLIELTDPFYIFQLFSIILWMTNSYYAYAILIIVATSVSLLVGCWETRENLLNLQQMAKYSCDINVYRIKQNKERQKELKSSTQLVPGDLIEIPDESFAMPCDCLLINGTVIVNEAMLTGESTPIIKTHLPNIPDIDFSIKSNKKYLLFAGTRIIQKRSLNRMKVIGIVYSTGFNTTKGNLIRSILFPKEIFFQFKNDSVKYIYFMAFISLCGFMISFPFLRKAGLSMKEIIKRSLDLVTTTVPPALPACLGIGISYALGRLKKYGIICINRDRVNIAGKINMICFDKTGTLTEDHLDIYGFRPVIHENNTFHFGGFMKEMDQYAREAYDYYKEKRKEEGLKDKSKDLIETFVECLATCHSVTRVKGKLIGDPIDVQMFQSSEWELFETEDDTNYDALISTYVRPKNEKGLNQKLSEALEGDDENLLINQHYELGIVRRFEFSSKLQRMSVIVKDVNDHYHKIFCKGSPEQIKKLCRQDTIPSNFNEQLSYYTMKGYRVLALSTKLMKMTFVQAQELTRHYAETNMIFLGLLIVQNKLKKETTKSIVYLDQARLKMVMATGDNILTAIAVSKECSLIKNDAVIYSCEITKDSKDMKLMWTTIENFAEHDSFENNKVMSYPLKNENDLTLMTILIQNPKKSLIEHFPPEQFSKQKNLRKASEELFVNLLETNKENKYLLEDIERDNKSNQDEDNSSAEFNIDTSQYMPNETETNSNYIIAITGSTFELLMQLKDKFDRSKKQKYEIYSTIFNLILKHCYIYARMAPEHKTMLIESLKAANCTVLMCGDGANDCGALRAADVGVSLSPEEASIAAHFTSKIADISCLIKLLREGKASLVTSIQTFKYMMIYSIIQFISVTMLMIVNSYLSDYQFLATDVFIIFPLAFFFAQTGAHIKLTPHKPTDSLISMPIISSIGIQTVIAFTFQYVAWLVLSKNISWYQNTCFSNENITTPCWDNTTIYLVSNMQYFITAFSFSISKPFLKPIYTNLPLTLFMVFAFIYSIWLIVYPNTLSYQVLMIEEYGLVNFKYIVLGISMINFIFSYLTEKVLISFLSIKWIQYKYAKDDKAVNPELLGDYISLHDDD